MAGLIDWNPQAPHVPNAAPQIAHIGGLIDAFAERRIKLAELQQQKAIHEAQIAEQVRHNQAAEGIDRDQLAELGGYHKAATEAGRAHNQSIARQASAKEYTDLLIKRDRGEISAEAFQSALQALQGGGGGVWSGDGSTPGASDATSPATGRGAAVSSNFQGPDPDPSYAPASPAPTNGYDRPRDNIGGSSIDDLVRQGLLTPGEGATGRDTGHHGNIPEFLSHIGASPGEVARRFPETRAQSESNERDADFMGIPGNPESPYFGRQSSMEPPPVSQGQPQAPAGPPPSIAGAPGAILDAAASAPLPRSSSGPQQMPAGPHAVVDTFGYDINSPERRATEAGRKVSAALGPVLNTPYGKRALREVEAAQTVPGAYKTTADAVKDVLTRAQHYEDQANKAKRHGGAGSGITASDARATSAGFRGLTALRSDIKEFSRTSGIRDLQKTYGEISKAGELMRSKSGAAQAMAVDGFVAAARKGTVTAAGLAYISGHMAGGAAALEDAYRKVESGKFSDPSVKAMITAIEDAKGAILSDVERHHQAFVGSYYDDDVYRPFKANVENEEAQLFAPFGYKVTREKGAPGVALTGKAFSGRPGRASAAPPGGGDLSGLNDEADALLR